MWDNVRMLGPAFPERLKYLRLFNDKERLLRSTQHPAGDSESLNLFCLLLVISETFKLGIVIPLRAKNHILMVCFF